MKRCVIWILTFLLFNLNLHASERDIPEGSNQCLGYFCLDCLKFFKYRGMDEQWDEIGRYAPLIPLSKRKCERCELMKKNRNAIYAPYISEEYQLYFDFLKEHLLYCSQNPKCQCYWPETSAMATNISEEAYILFSDLFTNTALSIVVRDKNEQKKILALMPFDAEKFSHRGIVVTFISKAFFYSHYCRICRDLDKYSNLKFNDEEYGLIQDKLENILETLKKLYQELYKSCDAQHSSHTISQEREYISLFSSEENEHICDHVSTLLHNELQDSQTRASSHFRLQKSIATLQKQSERIDWIGSEMHLQKGILLNNCLLYADAINAFSEAIRANPFNHEAYIERAAAYFESNQLSLALQDYEQIKKITIRPPFQPDVFKSINLGNIKLYMPKNPTEFANGLLFGTIEGSHVSVNEFIPSLLDSCRGLLHGLWCFACSPIEIGKEMLSTAYTIGELVSGLSCHECLELVIPELKELSLNWNKLDEYTRGKKIGFIIGKYGVEIFAPAGAVKAVGKYRALKKANTMLTLECCATSQAKQVKILEESAKRAGIREALIAESAKTSKILIKNSNVKHHIMQKKHAWDKVVKLSGNVEEDFKTVVILLEKNDITNKAFIKGIPTSFPKPVPKIIRSDHERIIGDFIVEAVFETYMETGQIFLKDAWVKTK